jgi:hypothetical protein
MTLVHAELAELQGIFSREIALQPMSAMGIQLSIQ